MPRVQQGHAAALCPYLSGPISFSSPGANILLHKLLQFLMPFSSLGLSSDLEALDSGKRSVTFFLRFHFTGVFFWSL